MSNENDSVIPCTDTESPSRMKNGILFACELFCEFFACFAADAGLFVAADFFLCFGDDGGNRGRPPIIVDGDERHVGVADELGFPRNFGVDSHDLDADFHGGVEGAVDGSLDGEDGADGSRFEKAHVVNRNRGHSASGVRVGSNAGRLVEERRQVSAEYKIVGVYVGGVDDVAGFNL